MGKTLFEYTEIDTNLPRIQIESSNKIKNKSYKNTGVVPAGISSIYSFPYRIFASEELRPITGNWDSFKIQIYTPIAVNNSATPISPDVNFELWPTFRWSALVEKVAIDNKDLYQVDIIGDRNDTTTIFLYDALRINIFGSGDLRLISSIFCQNLLSWLRLLSFQSWINSVDFHHHTSLKYEFNIDENGHCLSFPLTFSQITKMKFNNVNNNMLKDAFRHTIYNRDPPQYYLMLLDANNSFASGNLWEATLMSVQAIEVAKNVIFEKLYDHVEKEGIVRFTDKNLEKTDLTKVLSKFLDPYGRNLEKEEKILFLDLADLFTTRHHLAHGKKIAYKNKSKVNFDDLYVYRSLGTALYTIRWIESLLKGKL